MLAVCKPCCPFHPLQLDVLPLHSLHLYASCWPWQGWWWEWVQIVHCKPTEISFPIPKARIFHDCWYQGQQCARWLLESHRPYILQCFSWILPFGLANLCLKLEIFEIFVILGIFEIAMHLQYLLDAARCPLRLMMSCFANLILQPQFIQTNE